MVLKVSAQIGISNNMYFSPTHRDGRILVAVEWRELFVTWWQPDITRRASKLGVVQEGKCQYLFERERKWGFQNNSNATRIVSK